MIMDDRKWIALQYVLKFALDHIKGLYEPIYKYQSFLRVFMFARVSPSNIISRPFEGGESWGRAFSGHQQ